MRFLLLTLVLLTLPSQALTPQEVPNPLTAHDSWFSDTAGVMEADTIARLDELIDELENVNGTQIAVVTLKTSGSRTPKAFATELFNLWGVGEAGTNNGVMVLVAMQERRVEIEVGDGANLYLTDAMCSNILQRSVVPHFKSGDANQGVAGAVNEIVAALRSVDYSAAPPPQPVAPAHSSPRPEQSTGSSTWLYGSGAVVLFGGFLGLRRHFRNKPRICPSCEGEMHRLDENLDDEHLDQGQRKEENLGSVDYDVWVCDRCDEQKIVRYATWFSSFSGCTRCNYRTLESESETITSATTSSEGRGKTTEHCRHCGYHNVSYYTIARIQESDSSSSSFSSGSSSGGFGGGSSSGGGSGASW